MCNASTAHSNPKFQLKFLPNFENQKLNTHLFFTLLLPPNHKISSLPILPSWDQTSFYGYQTPMENISLNQPTILQPNSLIPQPQTNVSWKKLWKLKAPERIKKITSSATLLIPKRYNSVNFYLCVWVRVLFGLGFWIFSPYLLR